VKYLCQHKSRKAQPSGSIIRRSPARQVADLAGQIMPASKLHPREQDLPCTMPVDDTASGPTSIGRDRPVEWPRRRRVLGQVDFVATKALPHYPHVARQGFAACNSCHAGWQLEKVPIYIRRRVRNWLAPPAGQSHLPLSVLPCSGASLSMRIVKRNSHAAFISSRSSVSGTGKGCYHFHALTGLNPGLAVRWRSGHLHTTAADAMPVGLRF